MSSPDAGIAYTNFNRFFNNLREKDANGNTMREVHELRYANISVIAWTTGFEVPGMRYGASVGIPFSTGNISPSAEDVESSSFGLGDILITPLALYGKSTDFDYQVQFTAKKERISMGKLKGGGRRRKVSALRATIAKRGLDELGLSMAEVARHVGVTTSSIARMIEE